MITQSTHTILSSFCIAALAYFQDLATLIPVLLVFLTVDFFTGIYASCKLGVKIESHKLRKSIEKFVLYSVSVILALIFQTEFFEWANLARIVAGFIVSVELFSIYENVQKVTGLNINSRVKSLIQNHFGRKPVKFDKIKETKTSETTTKKDNK
jgi:phage-related holin